ncbi:MAG: hypothetical protein ACRDUV_19620 [Pseudonocardiaceae bacterium]
MAISSLRQATAAHRLLDATVSSRQLIEPVVAHLRFAAGIADRAAAAAVDDGRAAVSEIAGLAAWLHWDVQDVVSAQKYYALAVRAAKSAEQPMLVAYMLGSMAQLRLDHNDAFGSAQMLTQARLELSQSKSPTVLAWLSSLEARASVAGGDHQAAVDSLAVARDAAQEAAETEDIPWPWMSAFAPGKVAAQCAFCAAESDDDQEVHSSVEEALRDGLGEKQRALLQLTRAEAFLRAGDVGTAFGLAAEALDTGLRFDSARAVERARQLRRSHRGSRTREVREFDEVLRTWTVGRT